MDRRVQHRDQEVDDLARTPESPTRQRVRPQEEHRPHDVVGQRVADQAGRGSDEVALEADVCAGSTRVSARSPKPS